MHFRMNTVIKSALSLNIFVLGLIVSTTSVSFAHASELHYLKAGKPPAADLLAPPPLPGSVEQAADMETVRAAYHTVASNDMALAYSEKKFSVFNFAQAVGPFFVQTNLPKTTAFFQKVQKD